MLSALKTIIFLTCLIIFFPITAICQDKGPTAAEYGVVLNLSGKQRMLTQKMSKEMMLISLNYDVGNNLKKLEVTANLFDKTLKGLRDGDAALRLPPTVSKRIIKQLDKINTKYWQDYYGIVREVLASKKVNDDQVAKLAETNVPLLKQMNKCVKLYEKDASKAGMKSDPGLAVTINLSGKQRMLTQKMSKEFLLIAYGYQIEANKLNLLETTTLFDRTILGLMNGDEVLDLPGTKNESIRGQLKVVMGLWKSFKPIVEGAFNSKKTIISADQIAILAKSNLPLLKEMNRAVGMYEKEAAQ